MTRSLIPCGAMVLALATAACAGRGHEEAQGVEPLPPAPLGATQASTLASLCADEPRSWAILVDDEPVAVTRGRCVGSEKEDAGWHLVSQLQLVSEDDPRYELHMWLSDQGEPTRAQYRTAASVVEYAWAEGKMRIRQHGDTRVIEASPQTWVFPSHAVYLREAMLRLGIGGTEAGAIHSGYLPEADALSRLELRFETDMKPPRARTDGASFALRPTENLDGLRIESAEASGTPLYRAMDAERFEPKLPERPRPRYTLPDDLVATPIGIGPSANEPVLAGEFVMLQNRGPEPGPGVLFVSTAGPQDRHGFVPNSSIDVGSHAMQDALAREGMVVLRMDDRGVGLSGASSSDSGFDAEVGDARRALEALAERAEVDPAQLFVVGHGEGALRAIMAAQKKISVGGKSHRVKGVVLLAAPGRNLHELALDDIRHAMAERPAEEIAAALDIATRAHEAARKNAELPAEYEPRRNWMKEAFALEPMQELSKLTRAKIPVLALQGSKDFQVDPRKDFGVIEQALDQAGPPSGSKEFDDLDHLFKLEPGTSTSGHYGDLARQLDPAVIDAVTRFVRRVLGN